MIYRQTSVYRFLYYCNLSNLDKLVVDCGAGGNMPPLGMFRQEGYQTVGIELDEEQLEKAKEFGKEHGLELDLRKGDLRNLPFEEGEIPFLYSFGTIFHMPKQEIREAITEIKRVLKKEGLFYLNLLSTEDFRYGSGIQVGEGEYLQQERGQEVIHSYFEKNEADSYFDGFQILYKEDREYDRMHEGQMIHQGSIEYIVKKL